MILSLLLIFLAGLCKALSDTISFKFGISKFSNLPYSYWNPVISWKNKYKNGDKKQGEKFLFSTTALCFTTDAWHLFNFLQYSFFTLAILTFPDFNFLPYALIDFIAAFFILKLTFSSGFTLGYNWIFIK